MGIPYFDKGSANPLLKMNQQEANPMTTKGPNTQPALLPCPFCGGEPHVGKWDNGYTSGPEVTCYSCHYALAEREQLSPEHAIRKWNTRAQATPPSPPLTRIKAIIAKFDKTKLGDEDRLLKLVNELDEAVFNAERTPSLPSEPLREALRKVSEHAAHYAGCQCGTDKSPSDDAGDCWPCRMMGISDMCEEALSAPVPAPVNTALPAGSELLVFVTKLANNPTGGVGCNPELMVQEAREVLENINNTKAMEMPTTEQIKREFDNQQIKNVYEIASHSLCPETWDKFCDALNELCERRRLDNSFMGVNASKAETAHG